MSSPREDEGEIRWGSLAMVVLLVAVAMWRFGEFHWGDVWLFFCAGMYLERFLESLPDMRSHNG